MTTGNPLFDPAAAAALYRRKHRIREVERAAGRIIVALLRQAALDDELGGLSAGTNGLGDPERTEGLALAALIVDPSMETSTDELLADVRRAARHAAELRPTGADPYELGELDDSVTANRAAPPEPSTPARGDASLETWLQSLNAVGPQRRLAAVPDLKPRPPAKVDHLEYPPQLSEEWVTNYVYETELMRRHATDLFRANHVGHAPDGFGITDTNPIHDLEDGPTRVVSCSGCGNTLTITLIHGPVSTTVTAVERPGG